MYSNILSTAINGVEAVPVFVEADLSEGLPTFSIVGSVSSQVREAQDRVRTALKNQKIFLPPKRLTLNLAPGDIRKEGARFDLPIAAAILLVLEKIPPDSLQQTMLIGELGLDGKINSVSGVLPSVIAAKALGAKTCVIPKENFGEARSITGIESIGLASLEELIGFCRGTYAPPQAEGDARPRRTAPVPDFSDICGQEAVKRAALISAAGFHNILLSGPPGSGKSMTARRLPGILPEMTPKEQQEVSVIYSVAGLLTPERPMITARPFRAPHHSLSPQALCGGGRIPRPGEITLAHRGVLFIDELPLMPMRNLEQLRGPLEDRTIRISRSCGSYEFPADFLFAAAMNPCPCGYFPDMNRCRCTEREIRNYLLHISQPILDRIDIRVEVPAARFSDLGRSGHASGSTEKMKKMVSAAFARQKERYRNEPFCFNSGIPAAGIGTFCPVTAGGKKLLAALYDRFSLSARAYHRILRLGRTIADLEEVPEITEDHISEALCYRQAGGEAAGA